jgi:transposase, IS6 family
MNVACQSITRQYYRWVQAYAPELEKRIRPHLRLTNDSYRVDETYIKVKGAWKYLYRAVDSTGQTIDFMLSGRRDKRAAKRFFRKMLKVAKHQSPRVINVDQNKAYPPAIEELKNEGVLAATSQLRQCKYLNNILEQDHRFISSEAEVLRYNTGHENRYQVCRALNR